MKESEFLCQSEKKEYRCPPALLTEDVPCEKIQTEIFSRSKNMEKMFKDYIGVFDSGVGGISVLKDLVRELPDEDFMYFGDSAHAPYGEKTPEEVIRLADNIAEDMIEAGVKAVVIACNTATSAAARGLRESHPEIPIIAVEPALKPAVLHGKNQRILVMATSITLSLDKYHQLFRRFGSGAEVISVPCVGLAERIEEGAFDDPDLKKLLEDLIGKYRGRVDSVVLGCTHYPFIKKQIREVLGDVPFFDGGDGTARELRRRLTEENLLSDHGRKGRVEFYSSRDTEEEIALYQWFYRQAI